MSYGTRGVRFGGHQSFSAGQPMTDDDLYRIAPSIFATDKHESRSAQYAYIPTFQIVAGLRKEGFVPVRAIQGKSRTEGKEEFTKHMIRFQHPDYQNRTALAGVAPEVVLMNAHDGTSSYRMLSGVFRSICTNSMIVMEDGATDVRVPHKGDVMSKVIEGSFEVLGESAITLQKAEQWQGVRLLRDEAEIMAEAAHVLRFGETPEDEKPAIKPIQLLRPRRTEDAETNLWNVHNVLQENMIRGGLHGYKKDATGRTRHSTTREVKNIDGDVKLNRALWLLSHKMAELKRAA